MSESINVNKLTLSTGKVVLLRPLTIRMNKMAMRAAAISGGENKFVVSMQAQEEILKQALMQVDGKTPTRQEIENLDGLFTYGEYAQIMKALDMLSGSGADDMGKLQLEVVNENTGSK